MDNLKSSLGSLILLLGPKGVGLGLGKLLSELCLL